MQCPECSEDVHVGTAGPAGLAQHQGKGPCREAREKKDAQKKTRKLFDFGWKKRKDNDEATNMPSFGESSGSTSRLPIPAPVMVVPLVRSTSGTSERRNMDPQIQEHKGCEFGRQLIEELKAAAANLGSGIRVAQPDDKISGFGRVRAEAECLGVANDKIWETVNLGLDRFFGFGRSSDKIKALVCRGEMGVEGFCQFLLTIAVAYSFI